MPTEVSGGGGGTQIQPGTQGHVFEALQLAVRSTTATYPDPPADLGTPVTDTALMALYSTGQYVLWTYDVSATQWVAWEGAAVA